MEENESKIYSKVPAKISKWDSFKSFWMQEITVELTPKQKKVFKEVSDFWNQEIYFDKGFHIRPCSMEFADEQELKSEKDEAEAKISL